MRIAIHSGARAALRGTEHEPQFWGFDTNEEWEEWLKEIGREGDEKYYIELLRDLHGEPHDSSWINASPTPKRIAIPN